MGNLENQGYALARTWGGQKLIKYYRPDGGEVWKPPSMVERGGVEYDILLLKGYTFTPPEHPKIHCDGCTKWHDTQEEVDACVKRCKASALEWERKTARLRKGDEEDLRKQVAELQKMVKELLKK